MIRISGTHFVRNYALKHRYVFFTKSSSADDTVGSEHSKHVVRVVKAGWQAERLQKLMKCQDQYFALPSYSTAMKSHYRRRILTNACMKMGTALHYLSWWSTSPFTSCGFYFKDHRIHRMWYEYLDSYVLHPVVYATTTKICCSIITILQFDK
jgi:hypothetical protein